MTDSKPKKVIIVGGGFAGLCTAKQLAGAKNLNVTLIDKRNHHLFQPLLYQVAMAGLNPSEISVPFRGLFSNHKNVQIILSEVTDVDVTNSKIQYDTQWTTYDYLVLACGSKHSYFGNDDWEKVAPGLKTIEQATEIRRRVLLAFELAEKEPDPAKRNKLLTFVVVGGGPTGVELAGSIAEMAKKTLYKDYLNADLKKTKVILVEGGPQILGAFPKSLSERAVKDLECLGVEVVRNQIASNLTEDGLTIGDSYVEAQTIIWAAGVKASPLSESLPTPKSRDGRVLINADLSLPDFPNVFVLGDQAAFNIGSDDEPHYLPSLAPVAMQQGRFLGKLLKNDHKGKPRPKFSYLDKGIMATIGRSKAVVSTGPFKFTGLIAWLIWVFIHVAYLIRYRNRVFVLLQWAWAYFNFGTGARLIINKSWRFYDK